LFLNSQSRKKEKILFANNIKYLVFKSLILSGSQFATSSVLVRKKIINQVGGFDEDKRLITCEDLNCWLSISLLTEKFCAVQNILGVNLIGHDNASNLDFSLPLNYISENFIDYLSENDQNYLSLLVYSFHLRFLFQNKEYLRLLSGIKNSIVNYHFNTIIRFFIFYIYPRIERAIMNRLITNRYLTKLNLFSVFE